MAAPVVPPDQGLESYNQQIALHPLPPGTPGPQPLAPQPSGAAPSDSGHFAASVPSSQPTATPDAGAFVAPQMQATAAPMPAPAMSDSTAAVLPSTPASTIADSGLSQHVSLSSGSGYESFGWFVVPSASNQYGEGLGDSGFKIDLAGDVVTDWYFV
jgi:hypothetical protein